MHSRAPHNTHHQDEVASHTVGEGHVVGLASSDKAIPAGRLVGRPVWESSRRFQVVWLMALHFTLWYFWKCNQHKAGNAISIRQGHSLSIISVSSIVTANTAASTTYNDSLNNDWIIPVTYMMNRERSTRHTGPYLHAMTQHQTRVHVTVELNDRLQLDLGREDWCR